MRAKDPPPIAIRLLTHNIRYATEHPFKGEEVWPIRLPRLLAQLRFQTAHCAESIICLQEVLDTQLQDILSGLNGTRLQYTDAEWSYVGVGRDDGKKAGEYSPIIYRTKVWACDKWKTIWLSETPDTPGRGWDAASVRIVTIAVLKHKESGRRIVASCTHLDDQGKRARKEGAKLIIKSLQEETQSSGGDSDLPVFLAGDFNSETDQEAYLVLDSEMSPVTDLRNAVKEEDRYGHENTFSGFGYEKEPNKRIDFLFLGKGKAWRVGGYGVLENRFDDGVYLSDHRAVVGDVVLTN